MFVISFTLEKHLPIIKGKIKISCFFEIIIYTFFRGYFLNNDQGKAAWG